MSVVAVVGGQWGDEGKGKIVDLLAGQAKMVVRFQGGGNAGHTVINHRGEFRLHLIPSGIFDPQTKCIIGNGVVVDPALLLKELDALGHQGVAVDNLLISDRAHVVMPYHIVLDCLEEQARAQHSIGTTGKGIGPCYVDKVGRRGIRVADLLDEGVFRDKLDHLLPYKNDMLAKVYGSPPLDGSTICEQYREYARRLERYVADTATMLQEAAAHGDAILLEGAQGTMLDVDFGTYPYVTSSSPCLGGACSGSGLSPRQISCAIGVFKAYSTRVGRGPFPTELLDATGALLRERGHEFGTTTGRARRCGWFDAVAARYAVRLNGLDAMAVTRLDILDTLPVLRIATGYRHGGRVYDTVPADTEVFENVEPIYEELPGWQRPISDARRLEDLPVNARRYVDRLAELAGAPADIISVGARREQTIVLREPFSR